MKVKTILAFFLLSAATVSAQQLVPHRLLGENMAAFNPAAKPVSVLANKRRGFVDLGARVIPWGGNAPSALSAVLAIELDSRNMLGLNVRSDEAGIWSQTRAAAQYAYTLGPKRESEPGPRISGGISIGWSQSLTNPLKAQVRDPGDIVAVASEKNSIVDIGIGLFYYQKTRGQRIPWYAGVSVQNLPILIQGIESELLSVKPLLHYFGFAGHQIDLVESYLEVIVAAKYVKSAPFHAEGLARLHFLEKFWFGAGYSIAQTFALDVGLNLEAVQLGIAVESRLKNIGANPLIPALRMAYAFGSKK